MKSSLKFRRRDSLSYGCYVQSVPCTFSSSLRYFPIPVFCFPSSPLVPLNQGLGRVSFSPLSPRSSASAITQYGFFGPFVRLLRRGAILLQLIRSKSDSHGERNGEREPGSVRTRIPRSFIIFPSSNLSF